MTSTLSYGEMMARAAYQRKQARLREEANKTSSNTSRKPPSEPKLNLNPEIDPTNIIEGINWESTQKIVDELNQFVEKSKFTILRMPTGTGKTAVAVAQVARLGKNVPFVVVAPKAVVQGKGWQRTIAAWNRDHPEHLLQPIMIESHDRFANILKHPASFAKTVQLLKGTGVIILDEVHAYKTPTSKRSKTLQKLRAFRKIGLTATPFTNDAVMDGISYLVTAGFYTSKTNFYKTSGLDRLLDHNFRPIIYENNRVSTAIWPYYETMKRELSTIVCTPEIDETTLDMPNVHKRVIQLDHDKELMDKIGSLNKAYKRGAFESAIDFAMALVSTVGQSRVRLEKLVELISQDGVRQPLIFYWNNAVRDTILDFLHERGITPQLLAGDHPSHDLDYKNVTDPILIQYQAGAEGVEFKESNISIFYQNQSSASKLLQARGRNVRRGMSTKISQYALISQTAFDNMLYTVLENRMELSQKMLEELAVASIKEQSQT